MNDAKKEAENAVNTACDDYFFATTRIKRLQFDIQELPEADIAEFRTSEKLIVFSPNIASYSRISVQTIYLHEYCHLFFRGHDVRFALLFLSLLMRLGPSYASQFSLYDCRDLPDGDRGDDLKFVIDNAKSLSHCQGEAPELAEIIDKITAERTDKCELLAVKLQLSDALKIIAKMNAKAAEKMTYASVAGAFFVSVLWIAGNALAH